jgi:hypothetical protein
LHGKIPANRKVTLINFSRFFRNRKAPKKKKVTRRGNKK